MWTQTDLICNLLQALGKKRKEKKPVNWRPVTAALIETWWTQDSLEMESPGLVPVRLGHLAQKLGQKKGGQDGTHPTSRLLSLLSIISEAEVESIKQQTDRQHIKNFLIALLLRKDCTKAVKILWYFGFGMTPKALGNVLRAIT